MEIKIINRSKNENPSYATEGASGFDLRANLVEDLIVKPLERVAVPTGLFLEIPVGYEGQIRARSGMSLKHGITMANGVGTIDSDYRGEIKLKVINHNQFSGIIIEKGERIAQLVIVPYLQAEYVLQDSLDDTDRGEGGFGSTGKNRWEVIR